MKTIGWSDEKNIWLKRNRKVCFEDIVSYIESGNFKIIEHPNQKKCLTQKTYLVVIDNYAYWVPFVENFFKNHYPDQEIYKINK